MSSSGSETQNEWLVILPDKTDADAVKRRLEVRGKHLEAAMERASQGIINFGGIMLHEHIKEGETPKFKGSIMLFKLETKEEVLEIIKSDKYIENNVWDLEKMEIYPFRTALRKAL
ncbi:hypothetical protein H072_10839 [Dactylellina haptotyla CBS 200.50]|uniref:YCII-related domain-containing protein n=1 Tax=Dactylellina haptotyla (strain CBS 200.50) TaxID=1284197 RepID=S8A3G6_DACHA|nr:hypothetical protein H072_10839 [Dactylellina haptotyla CBS 200.50]